MRSDKFVSFVVPIKKALASATSVALFKSVYLVITLAFVFLTTAYFATLGTQTTHAAGVTKYARAAGGAWNAAGTWALTSGGTEVTTVPTAEDDVILDNLSGSVTIPAAAVAKTLTCTGYTGTLTHNAFTLTLSGSATFDNTMTYTPLETATISFNQSATLTTDTLLMPNVTTTSGALTIGDNLSFMASKIIKLTHSSTTAINQNGKTISGNSSINRVQILSGTLGTARTITVASGTYANADFQDITFANGGSDLNLSAITGLSGDCGGNTISGGGTLTFTAAAAQTWSGTTSGNWSTNAWTTRVPLPQDNVTISSEFITGQTVTSDMPRAGKSITWNNSYTGITKPKWAFPASSSISIYGSLVLDADMSMNVGSSANFTFSGRATDMPVEGWIISSAGVNFNSGNQRIQAFGATYILQNDFRPYTLFIENGTFDANDNNIFAYIFYSNGTYTRTINMGSGTWSLAANTPIFVSSSGMTFNCETSTISLTITAAAMTFNGSTLTYHNILLAPGAFDAVFNGGFTFNNMEMASAGTRTIKFEKSKTFTMTGTSFLNGSATGTITISSSDGIAAFKLSKASGIVVVDYANVSYADIDGVAKWFLTSNSTPYPNPNQNGNLDWSSDTTAPTDPTVSAVTVGGSAVTTGVWINYNGATNFTFSGSTDPDSALAGYYIYFGTNPAADPSTYQAHSGAEADAQTYSTSIAAADDGKHFYFRLKTKDVVGNIGAATALFDFGYDITLPTRPASVTANPPGLSTTNSFDFSWPAGTDPNGPGGGASGIEYYEYKRATDAAWSHTLDASQLSVVGLTAYQEGENLFYVKTVDNAGNTSSDYQQTAYYYSGTPAPTPTPTPTSQPSSTPTSTTPASETSSVSSEVSASSIGTYIIPKILETGAAPQSVKKKNFIELADFQYYLVLEDGNLEIDINGENEEKDLEITSDSKILVEIPADIFAKEINVITITTADSAYLMNYLEDKNKFQAVIPMPKVKGKYELRILIVYKDQSLQEIKKTISVDPQGYIYTMSSPFFGLGKKQEIRMQDAEVTLYKVENDKSQRWISEDYKQRNPATTDKSGEYSFFVPNGQYYLEVKKDGYRTQRSENFTVENKVLNKNIELVPNVKPSTWLIVVAVSLAGLSTIAVFYYKKQSISSR
jgi:hypothetical protein